MCEHRLKWFLLNATFGEQQFFWRYSCQWWWENWSKPHWINWFVTSDINEANEINLKKNVYIQKAGESKLEICKSALGRTFVNPYNSI